jgi:hypothetical protein
MIDKMRNRRRGEILEYISGGTEGKRHREG